MYQVSKNIHLIDTSVDIYIYIYKRDLDREAALIYRTSDFAGKVGHRISVIKDLIIE